MSTTGHILNLIFNSYYLLALGLAVVLFTAHTLRELVHTRGMRWSAGEPCPHCGKPMAAGTGRSIGTIWRPVPWLRCEGWPKCDFSTRRIAVARPATGNVVSFDRRKAQEMRQ
jgi:hypothetical protein